MEAQQQSSFSQYQQYNYNVCCLQFYNFQTRSHIVDDESIEFAR